MMIPMVGLVILVMFISNSASEVKKTGTGGTSSGGDESVKFSVFHFPYAGLLNKSRVYTRVTMETATYAFLIRKIVR